MKKYIIPFLFLFCILLGGYLIHHPFSMTDKGTTESKDSQKGEHSQSTGDVQSPDDLENAGQGSASHTYINPTGSTVATRILEPEYYTRVQAEAGSLQAFLRDYPLKEDGSPVYLYNGQKKGNQRAHIAVLKLPVIEDRDFQQSADYDDSYETFVKYLKIVFAYAGTLSMEQESEKIAVSDVRAGDIILKGGSPGHVVMVIDVCENEQGEKAFLLAQGYMPAQEFHILKNPLHENDPWYYENEIDYPLKTPEYTFPEGSFKRLSY